MKYAYVNDWVEIEEIILSVEERAPRLPEDTKQTPLKQWVKGKLLTEKATIGDEVEIETLIGRRLKGTLSDIKLRHNYDFGEYVDELIDIGIGLRQELEELK